MPFIQPKDAGACITIQAPPKHGKTTSVGGLIDALKLFGWDEPPMIWSEEAGHIVIPNLGDSPVWCPPPPSLVKGRFIYSDAVDDGREIATAFFNSRSPALVVDTSSTYAVRVLRTVAEKPLPSGKLRQNYTSRDGVIINTPTESDYGTAQAYIKSLFYDIHQFCMQNKRLFVVLAHERDLGIESEGGIVRDAHIGPQFIGKELTREFPKVPHVICRLIIKSGRHHVQTRSDDGLYLIGDRLDVLPPAPIPIHGKDSAEIVSNWSKLFWQPVLEALNFRGDRAAKETP